MEQKQQPKKCNCERIEQVGNWGHQLVDKEDAGGPIVRCQDCDAEFNLTWEQWKKVPDQNKSALV